MAAVVSYVQSGLLTFKAALDAAALPFTCQATKVQITPSVSEEDPIEVLCGDKVGGGGTTADKLDFTVISDHSSVNGLVAWSWLHRGETCEFQFQPTSDKTQVWTGKVIVQALQVGGEVGSKLLTVDGSWNLALVTPPTGYGDGQLHPTPAGNKGAIKAGDIFPADVALSASDATNAAKLASLGYVTTGAAWTTTQKFLIGAYAFHWTGTAWAAGAAA